MLDAIFRVFVVAQPSIGFGALTENLSLLSAGIFGAFVVVKLSEGIAWLAWSLSLGRRSFLRGNLLICCQSGIVIADGRRIIRSVGQGVSDQLEIISYCAIFSAAPVDL